MYWAPRNALALFYGDGDEQFADIQIVGRADSGMDAVDHPGNVTAAFSLPVNTELNGGRLAAQFVLSALSEMDTYLT